MLGENIKILRKQKGFSQETLAQQLNVVRQTVSKWEKGISVPDAEMLNSLSELFEVPVSTLLGSTVEEQPSETNSKMDEIAKQLAILNEQLANQSSRKRRTLKRILIIIAVAIAGSILAFILLIVSLMVFRTNVANKTDYYRTVIKCELDGQTYTYEIIFDDNNRIRQQHFEGIAFDKNVPVDLSDYYINDAVDYIGYYFSEHGGNIVIIENGEPFDWQNF